MALANENVVISYTGSGSTVTFAYNFRILDEGDIVVQVGTAVQDLNVDYTVTGVGEASGGNVVFTAAPADASLVILSRDQVKIQPTTYTRGGPFQSSAHEGALDRLTMMVQELEDRMDRMPTLSLYDYLNGSMDPLEIPVEAGYAIGWNAAGDALALMYSLGPVGDTLAGFTVSPTGFADGTNIILDSLNKAISINSATWQDKGIQLQYNDGTPRAYVGDGANKYFQFDGTDFTWKGANTELTAAGKLTIGDIEFDGANARIQSTNYASGPFGAGFHLSSDRLEVGNAAIRGIFRTAVFEKDVLSVVGGSVVILPGDVLASDMTAADNQHIVIEGNETFSVGDVLRIKAFNGVSVDDEWFEVTVDNGDGDYSVDRDKGTDYEAGANPTWKKGAAVVNYGQAGDGYIYMTSTEGDAPRIELGTHAGAPWDTITQYIRIGELDNFLGYSESTLGIAIGEATKFLKYDPTNGMRIAGTITITAGSGIASLSDAGDLVTVNEEDVNALNLTNGPADANATLGATWGSDISNEPSALGDINAGEGTKLSGIAASATVGATWGTNLSNIPATLGAPGGAGLYLTATYLGYYTGAAWTAYIRSNGTLYMGDGSNEYLQYTVAGGLALSTAKANAITVKLGGSITLEVGGDLNFGLSDTNPSLLNWGSTYYGGAASSTGRGICWWPASAGVGTYQMGFDLIGNAVKRFSSVSLWGKNDVVLDMDNESQHGYMWIRAADIELHHHQGGGNSTLNMSADQIYVTASCFFPVPDSATTLGQSNYCWSNIYGDAGVTSCSDPKYKKFIKASPLGLNFINKLDVIQWEWRRGEGKTLERTWHGFLAPDVLTLLEDMGFTHDDFGGINLEDILDDEGNKIGENWGLRMDQFIGPMALAIQELSAEINHLKTLH